MIRQASLRNLGRDFFVCVILAAITFAAYAELRSHAFVNYDDPDYVTQNIWVQRGLQPDSIAWAFTTSDAWNYHPLTWLSHMLDVTLFGLNPEAHHLVNLAIHIANAMLLYLALLQMTGRPMRSAFVAAVFALHPLQVETVAWVAERKSLLATFFGFAAILAYVTSVFFRSKFYRRWTLFLFALSLLCKPTFITLPFVLVLLDYWPLRRGIPLYDLISAKFWLFVAAAGSCGVTIWAQHEAIKPLQTMPLLMRVENGALSYAIYLGKFFWPTRLAVFYPFPASIAQATLVSAIAIIAAVTLIAILMRRRAPAILIGWLWYLGTLVPAIGIVQVGEQARADRYVYIPLVGLVFAFTFAIPRVAKPLLAATAFYVLIALGVATFRQNKHWQDTFTLFDHAQTITGENFVIDNSFANAYFTAGDYVTALGYYERALVYIPNAFDQDFLDDLRRKAFRQSHPDGIKATVLP